MMINEQKKYPTHRMLFLSETNAQQGEAKLSNAAQIAAVWARNNDKQGGIIDFGLSPGSLGPGEYYLRENKAPGQGVDKNSPPKTYRISFSEKRLAEPSASQLGRPVDVAKVAEDGKVTWLIEPENLNNGVFFLLENERRQTQGTDKHAEAFANMETKKQAQDRSVER